MSFLVGIIGTLTGDKPSDWSNFNYAVFKRVTESCKQEWKKAQRMGKERFGIDINKASPEQKIQVFGGFAKGYFKTEYLNEENCLPERFEPYCKFIEAQVNKFNKVDTNDLLEGMCKRMMDEHVQVKKWK